MTELPPFVGLLIRPVGRLSGERLVGYFEKLWLHLGICCVLLHVPLQDASWVFVTARSATTRWVREWLYQQASAKLIETDDRAQYFWMTKSQEDVLANEHGPDASPHFMGGTPQQLVPAFLANSKIIESFKTGVGLRYDEYGSELAVGVSRELDVWVRHCLVEKFCLIRGLKEKLDAGALVADVGCGCGEALLTLARAFPRSAFHGYDTSAHALKLAQRRLEESGLTNVKFFNPNDDPLPGSGTYDFMYTIDAIHDMAHPDRVLNGVRKALKDGGEYLICDFHSKDAPIQNIREMPEAAAQLYGFSVHLCMSSAMSDKDSMGLGTLGLTEVR